MKKYIKHKRAEAFFSFYATLSLLLKELRMQLEEKDLLNISDENQGNIYSLIYTEDIVHTICSRFSIPTEEMLTRYKAITLKIKETLLYCNNNVYPKKAKRKNWYESQYVIFSFCEFIENEQYWHKTNIDDTENGEKKHIVKCRNLVNAIDYILKSIEKAKY